MKKTGKNNTWNIIKHYGIKSVFFHYITSSLTISLLVFIPFVFLLFSYYKYVQTQELSRQSTINILQSKNLFESLTSDIHSNYVLTSTSNAVLDFLNTPETTREQILGIREFIGEMQENSSLFDNIYLYSFLNETSISLHQIMTLGNYNYYEWYRTYRSVKKPFLMFPRKNADGIFDKLYVCYEIYQGQELKGLFCIEMNYQKFASVIRESFVTIPDQIFVVSDIGLILYSDTPELINTLMFEKEDTYTAFQSATHVEGNSIIYGNYIIAVAKSTQSQLMIMSYIPKDGYHNNSFIYILIVSSCVVILILTLLLGLFFSFRHYRSVTNVIELLNNPLMLHNSNELINEFFYIANSISDISQQNENISTELQEKMYQLKIAQIAALQAQINPHFLFNTLQLINLSIIKEIRKDNMSTFLISQLSSLVRTIYDTENLIIPVSEELDITQMYLNIQQARYKSQLDISIFVQPECMNCKTVKLILQPIIENSIVHGFKGRPAPWHITIQCCLEEDYLVYQIEDNGLGIQKAELEALNEVFLSDKIDRSEKVGVSNVNQRLKLVFGRKCSMSISSTPNRGTTFTIRHIINPQL